MGYGDFKLFAALGAWLGWRMLLPIIVFASGVGAVFGIVIMIRQRKGTDTQIAFGPFLAIAGWLALIFGHDVVDRYLGLFAPRLTHARAVPHRTHRRHRLRQEHRREPVRGARRPHRRHRSARARSRRARLAAAARRSPTHFGMQRAAARRQPRSRGAARTGVRGSAESAVARAAHASGHPRSSPTRVAKRRPGPYVIVAIPLLVETGGARALRSRAGGRLRPRSAARAPAGA